MKLFLILFAISCVSSQTGYSLCRGSHILYTTFKLKYLQICDTFLENKSFIPIQSDYNIEGCYCGKNYVLDAFNQCVDGNVHCGKCGKNEEYIVSGPPCQTECATLGDSCPFNETNVVNGCFCKFGYARDESGVCIPIDSCPGNSF